MAGFKSVPTSQWPTHITWSATSAIIVISSLTKFAWTSGLPPEGHASSDFSFLCEDDPRCTCSSLSRAFDVFVEYSFNFKSVRLCNDTLEFVNLPREHMAMECLEETEENPYQYLPNKTQVYHYHVKGCPVPSQSYSASFKGILSSLDISCNCQEELNLTSSKLNGLDHISELRIRCLCLKNVSEDLLAGVSRSLSSISISDTLIESLPQGFLSGFFRLHELHLIRMRLKEIKSYLLNGLVMLKTVNLKENRLEVIEDDTFSTTNIIEHLNVNGNALRRIPTSLCGLRNLKNLQAQRNRITYIPKNCLSKLVNLRNLDLGENLLMNVALRQEKPCMTRIVHAGNYPESSSSLRGISDCFTFSNTIDDRIGGEEEEEEEKDKFFGSKHIIKFSIHDNNLTSFSDNFFYTYAELKEVDISRNQIKSLHGEMFSQNLLLENLNASHNQLTNVSENLLRNNILLRRLDLSRNKIATLGSKFFSRKSRLIIIYLNENRIHSLPGEIFVPLNVSAVYPEYNRITLRLDGNKLQRIPTLPIPRLSYLNVSRNQLTEVCAEMLELAPELLALDLSRNLLEHLGHCRNASKPLSEKYLQDLRILDLSENRLLSTPYMGYLGNIKVLKLGGNRLRTTSQICGYISWDIPRNMDHSGNKSIIRRRPTCSVPLHYRSLINLDLSRNDLELRCASGFDRIRRVWGCPQMLLYLQKLEFVDLSHNRIRFIPMELLHYLPRLKHVDLSHNSIHRLWPRDLLVSAGVLRIEDTLLEEESRYLPTVDSGGKYSYFEIPTSYRLTIDLRYNQIYKVVLPPNEIEIVPQDFLVDQKFGRATILLGGNPFNCDCDVFKLLQFAQREIRPVSLMERREGRRLTLPVKLDVKGLHCSRPLAVKGKAVSDPETWAHHLLPLIAFCHEDLRPSQPKMNLGRYRWTQLNPD